MPEASFDAPVRRVNAARIWLLARAFAAASVLVACTTPGPSSPAGVNSAMPEASTDAETADSGDDAGPPDGGTPGALSPLAAPAELVPLAVTGYRTAVVSVPIGAVESRPVVLALHGNYDRPEWQCEVWRGVTKGYPFVVCPRGVPRQDAPRSLDRWTYGKGADVRKEIDAALAAVKERYGDYVAAGPILYVGFSLGAIHGAGIVSTDAERFPRAVLIEGGYSWPAARAKSFAAAGGKRILFACGQKTCKGAAAIPTRVLERAGLAVRTVYGGEVGHTYDGLVAEEVAHAWSWLVEGDPRWGEKP